MSRLRRGCGGWHRVLTRCAVAVVAVLLGACSAAAEPGTPTADRSPSQAPAPAPTTSADIRLVVDLERPRYLAARKRVEVVTVNAGARPVTVSEVRLVGGGFADVPAVARSAVLSPGQRTDLQVAYGPPRCQAGAAGSPARVALVVDDGRRRRAAELSLPAGSDVLQRLHAEECFGQRLRETVDIRFDERWAAVPGRPAVTGTLRLQRLGEATAAVVIDDVAGNVIFNVVPLDPRATPLLTLDAGRAQADLPLQVDASRCEPHALAESKKTFRFPLWVSLDGAPPRYIEVEPAGAARTALQELVDVCAARMSADTGG